MRDLRNFSFFGRGDVSPTHLELGRFVSASQAKHQVSSPVIILLKNVCLHRPSRWCLGNMWLDLPFTQVSKTVQQNVHTTFSFPKPLSESEELQSWWRSQVLISFLMRSDGHFWPNQQQQQCLPQFELILDGHLSPHLLPAPFRLEIENTTHKRLIGSEPHSHNLFAPILVFLSQIDRLWNKMLWQLSVHFRHPWRIKTTDFTRQVITLQDKL